MPVKFWSNEKNNPSALSIIQSYMAPIYNCSEQALYPWSNWVWISPRQKELGRISQVSCYLDLLWPARDVSKETEEKKEIIQLAFLRDAMLGFDSLKENQFDFAMESTGKT